MNFTLENLKNYHEEVKSKMLIPLNYLIQKYNLDISGISHIGAHVGQEVEIYKENNIDNIYLF